MAITPLTRIDWSGDGSFTGTGEDVSLRVKNDPGIKTTIGRDNARDLTPPMAGKASFELNNVSKDYNLDNSSSPLFGLLTPGKKAQILTSYVTYAYTRPTSDSYDREGIDGVSAYTIVAGDILVYDIYWNDTDDFAAFDLSDGTHYLSTEGSGSLDQNGYNASPKTDISAVAYGKWYTRIIPLTTMIGYSINHYFLSTNSQPVTLGLRLVYGTGKWGTNTWYSNGYGDRSARFRNVRIVNSTGELRRSILVNPQSTIALAYTENLNITNVSATVSYQYIWSGFTLRLKPNIASEQQDISVPMLGSLSRLIGIDVSTPLYHNITIDQAVGYTLDAVGWPSGSGIFARNIESSNVVLNDWWLNKEDAFKALVDLFWTEGPGAELFDDQQGRISFYSHNHKILSSASVTSQGTFYGDTTEPTFKRPLGYDTGEDNIINSAEITTKIRSSKTRSTVWNYGSIITLAPNETKNINFSTDDPCDNCSIASPGGYTLASGGFTVAPTLNRTSGQYFTITMQANSLGAVVAGPSGSGDANGLTYAANLYTVDSTIIVKNKVDASTSITQYGTKNFIDPIRAEISVGQAQDIADAIVSTYKSPRKKISMVFNGMSWTKEDQSISRGIADRITVVETLNTLNLDFWIERIDHLIKSAGSDHDTIFYCEESWANNYFVIGQSLLGSAVLGF